MKNLTNRSGIKIRDSKKGWWMHGTLHTLKESYEASKWARDKFPTYQDWVAEQKKRGCGEVYGIQSALMIVASDIARAEIRKRQEACLPLEDGEVVLIDGEEFRTVYVGDYSDFIRFERV